MNKVEHSKVESKVCLHCGKAFERNGMVEAQWLLKKYCNGDCLDKFHAFKNSPGNIREIEGRALLTELRSRYDRMEKEEGYQNWKNWKHVRNAIGDLLEERYGKEAR